MEVKARVAIFASGRGSNARAIYNFQESHESNYEVAAIFSNRKNAAVLDFGRSISVFTQDLDRKSFYNTEEILKTLDDLEIDIIVLAGFLWLIPKYLVDKYPDRIVNIHPALLPKYGGKGMYGHHVHEAVFAAKDESSGITIHFVNEKYDEGRCILQTKCGVNGASPDEIAQRVLRLEHHFFPRIINGVSRKVVNHRVK